MDSSNSVWRGNAGRNTALAARVEDGSMSSCPTAPHAFANRDMQHRRDPPPRLRVAIIDSDSGFLAVLSNRLERLDWQHQMLAFNATAAKIAALELDVLILDLASFGAGRWRWLERLCEAQPSFGIVICTGVSTVQERVRALRLGVDDWLGKPCHAEELIARVETVAAARREPEQRSLEPIELGQVEIRPDLYQAFVDGVSLELTRREFQMIELLAGAGGEIVERELIYERLWGYKMARNDRSVDVFVHKLRRKLNLASPLWSYIHTEFRVGYRLVAAREQELSAPVELLPRHEPSVPLAA
jgi:DNA-binding response OmpR family regulator